MKNRRKTHKPRRVNTRRFTGAQRNKVHRVMSEFKHGGLHSGSKHGPKVKNRKQAVAIALSQARRHT